MGQKGWHVNKKILFPFSSDKSFNEGYTWAMELAARLNAVLFFFTAMPENETNRTEFVHHLSHSLLEAQGNYLQHAAPRQNPARTERHIGEGDFTFSLSKFVKKNRFDIVVIDPSSSNLPQTTLDYVVRNSDGVIVLPAHNKNSRHDSSALQDVEIKTTDNFYDVLHKSDLYKLPDNFFATLGQDKKLFNYLRSFFRRKGTTK